MADPNAEYVSADRYWWASGPDGVFIEAWRGEPKPTNVIRLARVWDIDAADALCDELNQLSGPVQIDRSESKDG